LRYAAETFIARGKLTSTSIIKNTLFGVIADIDEKINTQLNEIIQRL